jgi:peptidoglycan pentaglycine glycine transferase (the first glycine)
MSGYQVVTTRQVADPEWDAFVAATPGGTHQQSSMWAEVKAVQGWDAARVVLRRDGRIVGGCQALLRRLGPAGSVAYVPRGPVLADRDGDGLEAVVAALGELAAGQRLLYLKLQPPPDRHDLVAPLLARGFVESSLDAAYRATVQVDVDGPADELLRRLRASTRRNVRKAERAGVKVREGTEADFGEFLRLTEETGRRKQFPVYPSHYYETMWRAFGARGHARLLLAELDGRLLASTFLIAFGETVSYKMGGWAGEGAEVRPNELLQWTGIRWAHEHGHRFYDFEGINGAVARSLLAGGGRPTSAPQGVAHFKLGFGGEVRVLPATYDTAWPRPLAGALRRLLPQLDRAPLIVTAAKRVLRVGGR